MTVIDGSATRRRDERGGATVLLVATLVLVSWVTAAVVVLALYAHAAHRARAAADLAALAGAGAGAGRDESHACAQARRIAQANDARLTDCRVSGDQVEHVVKVSVVVRVRGAPKRLPSEVPAQAWAGRTQTSADE